jgi:hypothetical protein
MDKEAPSPTRRVPVCGLLALVALVSLSLAIAHSFGYYSRSSILGALLALGAACAACTVRPQARLSVSVWLGQAAVLGAILILAEPCLRFAPPEQKWERWLLAPGLLVAACSLRFARQFSPGSAILASAALLLAGKAVCWTGDLVGEATYVLAVKLAAGTGFLLIAATIAVDLNAVAGPGPGFRARLGLVFLAGALLRVATVLAVPQPGIDVYDWLSQAPAHVLEGINPYSATYIAGSTGHLPAYPPLPIVFALPFSAAGLDVRFANVVCDLVAALILYLAARCRAAPAVGLLAAATYLNLPRMPYLIMHAWFEPMLAATLGGGLFLLDRGWRLGHFVTGLGLTGKQFGIAMVVPLWRAHQRHGVLLLAGIMAALALLMLPFFLWGPADFLDVILYSHLKIPPDLQSLTLRSAMQRMFGLTPPSWALGLVSLSLIAIIAAKTRAAGTGSAMGIGTALLVFCLAYVKGYFNYFVLCEYLFLLGIVHLLVDGERRADSAPAVVRSCNRAAKCPT